MFFTADLHIHSRFSRATSKKLNARSLAAWAMLKGVNVLGTGDFTHPAWRAELQELLTRDEDSGLYRLRQPADLTDALPDGARVTAPEPLFLLQTEISSIYKRHGKVRKVHNLVFMPDMDAAERFSRRLENIGNLASDGRPILGLDAHDLLEIVLETSDGGVLVPAHIWTPWFALFGSKSGFDSLEECFDDLTPHIFALETGLSSDPAMNRLWSHLDGCTLISNSDAHSGENVAREVNCLYGRPSYAGIFAAMRAHTRTPSAAADCTWAGTAEFFPEEGKYHLDGHRACSVVLDPREARAAGDICPVCGKPLTIGVLHRVLDLADRTHPRTPQEMGEADCVSLVPLPELLREICGAGAKSQKVTGQYRRVLEALGPEMFVLRQADIADVRHFWEPLGEAVARMRAGKVIRSGGYDGEYGTVRVFTPQEAAEFSVTGGGARNTLLPLLSGMHTAPQPRQNGKAAPPAQPAGATTENPPAASSTAGPPAQTGGSSALPECPPETDIISRETLPPQDAEKRQCLTLGGITYAPAQSRAIMAGPEPVLVLAGPGAGKTRVLVGRVLRLLGEQCAPESLLAVTFTCRAAQEMQDRLRPAAPAAAGAVQPLPDSGLPWCDTIHALALRAAQLRQQSTPLVLDEHAAFSLFAQADAQARATDLHMPAPADKDAVRRRWEHLQLARETLTALPPDAQAAAHLYTARKQQLGVQDYTDLLETWLTMAEADKAAGHTPQWRHVLVDEIQDLSPLQLRLIAALLPPDGTGFFGIGDPDQSIYAFRGAQPDVAGQLRRQWPHIRLVQLEESYRAMPRVLACAAAVLHGKAQCGFLRSRRQGTGLACAFSAHAGFAEAQWIARQISGLLGKTSHTLLDEDKAQANRLTQRIRNAEQAAQESALSAMQGTLAPGDIAVLTRVKAQIAPLGRVLEEHGIPWAGVPDTPCWQDVRVARIVQTAAEALTLHTAAAQLTAHGMPALPLREALPPVDWTRGPCALPEACPAAFDPFFAASPAWAALEKCWERSGHDWPALLALLCRMQEDDLLRGAAQQVRLLTLHAAKGLEFRAVFIPGVEDGLLPLRRDLLFATEAGLPPHQGQEHAATGNNRQEEEQNTAKDAANSIENDWENSVQQDARISAQNSAEDGAENSMENSAQHSAEDEERRLLYVGITRAADAVFLSHARERRLYHRDYRLAPSPFLADVLPLCRHTALHAHTTEKRQQLSLL